MIINLISISIIICLVMYCFYLRKANKQVEQINQDIKDKNKELQIEYDSLEAKRNALKAGIWAQEDILKTLNQTRKELTSNAEHEAKQIYKNKLNELMSQVENRKQELANEYNQMSQELNKKIEKQQEQLDAIKAKQDAYIQAQQRQEAIAANQDYYRLALDSDSLDDVVLLRDIQKRMVKKDSIDKVIWDVYYKPAYDILMSHLFSSKEKIIGIYKLTSLTTGKAYIGQSVDIRERMRQHIKASLSYGTKTNKLYQEMNRLGPQDFIFEILEEVSKADLNEREKYWIEFYHTIDQLNSTRGGS